MSSANNLRFDAKLSDKLLIYIKNNTASRNEPWEALIQNQLMRNNNH